MVIITYVFSETVYILRKNILSCEDLKLSYNQDFLCSLNSSTSNIFLLWIVESCYFFHGRFSKSTFPPHRIIPTFFRSSEVRAWNFSVNTAATPTAADDSIISFIRSQTSLHAEIISSSVTVMTSVTLSRMIGQVFLPKPILRPSAIVLGEAETNKEIAV